MKLEAADIKKLLDAFEQSDWDEIRLSADGTDVVISASDAVVAMPAQSQRAAPSAPSATTRPEPGEPEVVPDASPVAPAAGELPEGTPVRSASPGIFWRSPAPGEPPFVEAGQRVEADTVVCIVEVMKLMNRVTAGVAGTVAAIVVDNSEQVRKDQTLMVITED